MNPVPMTAAPMSAILCMRGDLVERAKLSRQSRWSCGWYGAGSTAVNGLRSQAPRNDFFCHRSYFGLSRAKVVGACAGARKMPL